MKDTLISIEDLNLRIGSSQIIEKLNLDINFGEIFGLIGPIGSGKTTLLNLLSGAIEPSDGEISINIRHFGSSRKDLFVPAGTMQTRLNTGFGCQSPSFYPELTVLENMEYFASFYPKSNELIGKNINILLKYLQLDPAQKAENLSDGMKRKLDIACAMVHKPLLLLLDEPSANLDPAGRKSVERLLKAFNKFGTTIVLTSHHIDELDLICDRVGVLDNGTLVDVARPSKLKMIYCQSEKIILETSPGNYEHMIKLLKKDKRAKISRFTNMGYQLVIETKKSETLVPRVMQAIKESEEILINMEITKASMKEVLKKITKKMKKV